jgi:hypothetical protein
VLRTTEAVWSTGSELIAGQNNWVIAGSSNIPSEWTGTITGTDPGFVDAASSDFHLAMASPAVDQGASSLSGPPGYDFPSPLATPAYHPPLHAIEAPGAAVPRPVVGTIDIGAYEYGVGSGGIGGSAGASSGGTSSGGTSSGGTSSGGSGNASSGGSGNASTGGGMKSSDSGNDSGCGCEVPGSRGSGSPIGLLIAAFAFGACSRTRRRRR